MEVPHGGELVDGASNLRPNGIARPASLGADTNKRGITEQAPAVLYCSVQCQSSEPAQSKLSVVIDHSCNEPPQATVNSSAAPQKVLTSMDEFAIFYKFPELPPIPEFQRKPEYDILPYNSGIIMAGRLIGSLAPSPPPKSQLGRDFPVPEPRKPVAGWTDGSNQWRSVVYNIAAPRGVKPFTGDVAIKAYGSLSIPARGDMHAPYPPAICDTRAESASTAEALLSNFHKKFTRSTQSCTCLDNFNPSPAPVTPTQSPPLPSRTHRSLVPSSVEGKLLIPNVKMRIHRAGSGSSRSSPCKGHLDASVSSKNNAAQNCAQGSLHSDNIGKRPQQCQVHPERSVTENTCSWSYDNVLTYELMPFPPKKIKKWIKDTVDGIERDIEIEVEEYAPRKRLFLFPPSQRKFIP